MAQVQAQQLDEGKPATGKLAHYCKTFWVPPLVAINQPKQTDQTIIIVLIKQYQLGYAYTALCMVLARTKAVGYISPSTPKI